ncbi:MAG: non-canonical purine NTP pyrophosphatase [Pirellulales bacterium]
MQQILLYGLSLPERALRGGVGIVAGAVRESAALLVPQAFQDSKTYSALVNQTLEFLLRDIAGVVEAGEAKGSDGSAKQVDNFVARKAVGNFVDMASMATLHLSPLVVLAIVSDVAYGSTQYLEELAAELKREGMISSDASIRHANDLLKAVGDASAAAASAFDTPPISVEGLRETIAQTTEAASRIDPTKIIPPAELRRMWDEIRAAATKENVGIVQIAGAMSLFALNKAGVVSRGALSGVRVTGMLVDRHIFDHYRAALGEIRARGFYKIVAESSQPYVEALWRNFSTTKPTLTEELVTGKLLGRAWQGARKLFGASAIAAADAPVVVLGTRNRIKGEELAELLSPIGVRVRTLDEFTESVEVEETGDTFAANARLKATQQAKKLGQWVLGEDSGLSVDALRGAPGVFSARYSGESAADASNNARLLADLAGVPLERRVAHYTCHVALADPTGEVRAEAEAHCRGRIALKPAGTAGFGYDPLFEILEYHQTFGQLGPAVKRVLSHRCRAVAALLPKLRELIGSGALK